MPEIVEDMKCLMRTRHGVVTIATLDEPFAVRMIRQAADEMSMPVLAWSASEGLRGLGASQPTPADPPAGLVEALVFARDNPAESIYIFKDALGHLGEPTVQRLLRDVATAFSGDERTAFLVDQEDKLPRALQAFTVPYELSMPDEGEITAIIRQTIRQFGALGGIEVVMTRGQANQFINSLRGLSRTEISQVLAECMLADGRLTGKDIDKAVDFKRRRLRRWAVLDYMPPEDPPPRVGGVRRLRQWLKARGEAFGPEARKYGLDWPRGLLMLGVQGCGKSRMARFVASQWRMPLVRMEVGSLYEKYVGESEKRLKQAFAAAASMAPCVLWIDEIEKAFASATAGAAKADGGLSQRMFGQLLTWMQDRDAPVFIVATANEVMALPPELMRKGRFDEIFFVDLPDVQARREIFEIHLTRRKRSAEDFDLDYLAEAAEGFSGSEIEQAVVAAMYAAFAQRREVTTEDIDKELANTRPLSVLMAERVSALRDWAEGRCVQAN